MQCNLCSVWCTLDRYSCSVKGVMNKKHDYIANDHWYIDKLIVAGDDIRQRLEFHHVHLELGALGYSKMV